MSPRNMVVGDITRVKVDVLLAVANVAEEADVVADVMHSPWRAAVCMLFLCPGEVKCHLDTFP